MTQVELNGFIHSILSGTKVEQKKYKYFGKRAYSEFIADTTIIPIRCLNIPPREADAESGSAFMNRIETLALEDREAEIYKALSTGNMPDFLRQTINLHASFADSNGVLHQVEYEVFV
ncbi:MAG: hypothetical protein IPL55_18535 [Saprospiraceae bacterium]|nr:hypothetical protein [Saprospiraceae bacterium]